MTWKQPISLAIVGAEKAGTTALFRHLSQSPALQSHVQREMTCFVSDEGYAKGEAAAMRAYFPDADSRPLLMKDVMLMNFEAGLKRLKSSSPDVKVIAMLREPAARAWSAYCYARSRGVESATSFGAALALEEARAQEDRWRNRVNLYLYNSTYADKIALMHEIFGHGNVLVIFQSDYQQSPRAALASVEAFFGVPLFADGAPQLGEHNKAAQARSQTLAAMIARGLRSRGRIKRAVRALLPQQWAAALRHSLMRLNRVERANPPLDPEIARDIRAALADDAGSLRNLVGRCPWADNGR